MSIREILSLDAPERLYPATNKLQELVTAALQDDPDSAGDSPLVEALALAVMQLEQSLVDTKVAVINATTLTLNLRQATTAPIGRRPAPRSASHIFGCTICVMWARCWPPNPVPPQWNSCTDSGTPHRRWRCAISMSLRVATPRSRSDCPSWLRASERQLRQASVSAHLALPLSSHHAASVRPPASIWARFLRAPVEHPPSQRQ